MAFQQPQRQQPRPSTIHTTFAPIDIPAPARQRTPPPEREQWVLFSPASEVYDRTESTVQTDRYTGRLSDFGSLETAAVSERGNDDDAITTEDLDSLDDGLHAFNEPALPTNQHGVLGLSADSVMPVHDGLGMFPGDSSGMQEQFWQHERYNPRRRRSLLRRSSLQRRVEAQEEEREQSQTSKEDEKTQRIEQWRNEQSRAILEEIERETRRRRRRSRMSIGSRQGSNPIAQSAPETRATPPPEPTRTERLSFWERLTRRVIRDLIGIDDATLEYIFGESLPEEPPRPAPMPSAASAIVDYAEHAIHDDEQQPASSWEEKLLGRIAKELGILFNHISEHPGAFSTYLQTQDMPPYAGLPNPEPRTRSPQATRRSARVETSTTPSDPVFAPTMNQHRRHSTIGMDPSLWGIEEESEEAVRPPSPATEAARLKRDKEYWEKDLDVKMVFNFLRNRLSGTPASKASATTTQQPSSLSAQPPSTAAPPNTHHDSLRRAALIRHHHPLVRSSTTTSTALPRPPLARMNSSSSNILASGAPLSPILGRRSSRGADTESCASQSTKRSRTARSGSSRNYWDLGVGGRTGSDAGVGGGGVGSEVWSAGGGWGHV